jgi:hypothetical protein
MTTTSTVDAAVPTTRRRGSPFPALAGLGALAAFVAAAVLFGDPLGGATDAVQAAERLGGSSAELAAVLLGAYALLAIAVVGALAQRLARSGESAAVRLMPVLGAGHVLLLATAFTSFAAAVVVGTRVFDGGVTASAVEAALVVSNLAHPLSAWLGAAFLIAVAVAARRVSRVLTVVSAVFAAGLLLPPVGWAVTYLMGFWFAAVGVWLWRRG